MAEPIPDSRDLFILRELNKSHIDLRIRCDRLIEEFQLELRFPDVIPSLRSHTIEAVSDGLSRLEAFTLTGIDVLPPERLHQSWCPRLKDPTRERYLRLWLAPFARSLPCKSCGKGWRTSWGVWVGSLKGVPYKTGYVTTDIAIGEPGHYKFSLDLYHRYRDEISDSLRSIEALYRLDVNPSVARKLCEMSSSAYAAEAKYSQWKAAEERRSTSPPISIPVSASPPRDLLPIIDAPISISTSTSGKVGSDQIGSGPAGSGPF